MSKLSYALEESESEPVKEKFSTEAEIFGLRVNDLSQPAFEKQLTSMGLQPYPSYHKGVASYSLGPDGILGIKSLNILFNRSGYIRQAVMSGVVTNNSQRGSIGALLEKKYGEPTIGFVKNGYGRAKWLFPDGTFIELHNTTFDVSIRYGDEHPKVQSHSGKIDVEALSRKAR
ncbi:uridine kinase [Marinomonas transparens]|uniref:Uridine kinase n=1 Tax=Marinomonas transparens TaxID=2795388 RepID=A0A934N170_9GAMM|nr:uridine kinase [Marinomonas transparens]MBJ7539230.1 uridine kinase [Marinomonas transparens]